MRLPVSWLNEYVPNDLPLRELADVLTNMGLEVEAIEDAAGAAVFDIKVTPNRGDCLSVVGVARELATALRQEMRGHAPVLTETGPPAADLAEVILEDPDLCPRYSARIVRGVKIAPSPEWAQRRLEQCGLRPVSNVVDATNLVMLELGQPLHAFDYTLLKGKPTVIVRRSKPGEVLVTIDGEERALSSETLVIADPGGAVAIAGVMGGSSSEINDGTTQVLLESAHFNPGVVRRGARALQMSTEASYRFERTVDPGGTVRALDRACELIAEFNPTPVEIAAGAVDAYPNPVTEAVVTLRPARANALLGTDLTAAQMAEHLSRLQLQVTVGKTLVVQVPTFRQDIKEEIDLVEEIARAYGYQHILETLPRESAGVGRQDLGIAFDDEVRGVLRGLGLTELITSSLEGPEMLARLQLSEDDPRSRPVLLSNPKTVDRSQLRTTLMTSVLDVVATNQRHGVADVSAYDLGVVFLPAGPDRLPHQPQHLALAGVGRRWQGFWSLPKGAEQWDFFALKGVIEEVLRAVARVSADYTPEPLPMLAASQSARLSLNGETIGCIGQLSDAVRAAWDLPDPVFVAELDLDLVRAHARPQENFVPLSRFPASTRDVAFVLPRRVPARDAEAVIRKHAGPDLESLRLFDVYEGKPLPEGSRNLAYSLTFRRSDRTLAEEEVEAAMDRLRAALRADLGATIRE